MFIDGEDDENSISAGLFSPFFLRNIGYTCTQHFQSHRLCHFECHSCSIVESDHTQKRNKLKHTYY